MKRLIFIILMLFGILVMPVEAQDSVPFGVNLAGGEFGSAFPGVDGHDYGYPNRQDLEYWHGKGLQLVRIPFRWERLQHTIYGELYQPDLVQLQGVVKKARELGMMVLLDMHNYCRRIDSGKEVIIGAKDLPYAAYADFWKRMAEAMGGYSNIYGYGLMNEPHDLPAGIAWFDMAQAAIDAIRKADTHTPIVVGGCHWSSARRWKQLSNHLKNLKDPANNLVFEAHCYFDFDGSGTYKFSYEQEEGTPLKGIELVEPFVSWLKENHFRGIVGEYGIPEHDARWKVTADNFLKYLSTNGVTATYWASGHRWSPDAVMTIPTPTVGEADKPQLDVLSKYPHTAAGWRLRIDDNHRYITHNDGTPFLYLADTAWEMFARLDLSDTELYLKDRKKKGFTVIQTVLWTELDSIRSISNSYLEHVEAVLAMAEQQGLYIALLPTWGDKVDKQWGIGPEVFTPVTAQLYGEMISQRLAKYPNIIWVLGGDRSGEGRNKTIWNAMATGIKKYDKIHLMTYHPHGEHSSSMWFHNEPWLDFNMIQSGHCQHNYDIYAHLLLPDVLRMPHKPVMDGEPRYEDIVKDFNPANGRFTDFDVRKALYQSMLSGACGFTYGNNNVWQMYTEAHLPMCSAQTHWKKALDSEGANDMQWFVKLWHLFPFHAAVPMHDAVVSIDEMMVDKGVAMYANNMMIAYMPEGHKWLVKVPFRASSMQWLNPRTGSIRNAKAVKTGKGLRVVLPTEEDYILIIK